MRAAFVFSFAICFSLPSMATQGVSVLTAPCEVESFESFCQQLERLPRTTAVQVGAVTIPSCSLSSPENHRRLALQESIGADERLLGSILSTLPETDLNIQTRLRLVTSEPQVLVRAFGEDPTHWRPTVWPPFQANGTRRSVTRDEVEAWRSARSDVIQRALPIAQNLVRSRQELREFDGPTLNLPTGSRTRLNRLFTIAKDSLLRQLVGQPDLAQQVSGVELAPVVTPVKCSPGTIARYNVGGSEGPTGRVEISGSHLMLTDASLIRMLAHELSHSIDRCGIRQILRRNGWTGNSITSVYSMVPVYQCLTSEDGGQFLAPQNLWTINQGCTSSQSDEAFADAMATLVMTDPLVQAEMVDAPQDRPSLRDLPNPEIFFSGNISPVFYILDKACAGRIDQRRNSIVSGHPSWQSRYFEIMLADPVLRANLGCPAQARTSCSRPYVNH